MTETRSDERAGPILAAVPRPRTDRVAGVLTGAYALFVAAFVVFATWSVLHEHYLLPWADDWRILDDMFSQPLARFLGMDQVGHRLPVTLLLIHLDYSYFDGRMNLVIGASLACVAAAGAACYAAWRSVPGMRPLSRPAFLFSLFALVWAAQLFDLPWGTNQGTLMATAWLTTALALTAWHQRARLDGREPPPRLLGLALVCAVAATFSQGIGVATFAALFTAAVVGGFGLRPVALIVGTAIATVAVYGIGLQHAAADVAAYFSALGAPARLLEMTAAFLGAPIVGRAAALAGWSEDDALVGAATVGAIGAVAAIAWAVRLSAGRRASPLHVFGVGLAAFSLAGGVLVALNRSPFPHSAIALRFSTVATLFWVGIAALCGAAASERRRPGRGLAGPALAWLMSLAMLPVAQSVHSEHRQHMERQRLEWAMHRLKMESPREVMGTPMRKEPAKIFRVVRRLAHDRRGAFADTTRPLLGEPTAGRFVTERTPGRCRGTIRRTWTIEGTTGRGVKLMGRVLDTGSDEPPAFVLGTDSSGRVRALGELAPAPDGAAKARRLVSAATDATASTERPTSPAASATSSDARLEEKGWLWFGYLADDGSASLYSFSAVVDDGRTLCQFVVLPGTASGRRRRLPLRPPRRRMAGDTPH